jgi:hypothetical protein
MKRDKVIEYVVGSTCEPMLDDGGTHRLRWTLYLDVVNGNPDWIEKVTFDLSGCDISPPGFISSYPNMVALQQQKQQHNTSGVRWRFQVRPQTTTVTHSRSGRKSMTARVGISGAGGTRSNPRTFMFVVERNITGRAIRTESVVQTFVEPRSIPSIPIRSIPPWQNFGMELELTSAEHVNPSTIGRALDATLPNTVKVISSYSEARQHNSYKRWQLVPDASIQCDRSNPSCHQFELVSPILRGDKGLEEVAKVIRTFQANDEYQLKVNKSMGFHVHVDVSRYTLPELVKICQVFIKYETVMDSLLPTSRRTGSYESNQYFQSNRDAMAQSLGLRTNLERHLALREIGLSHHKDDHDGIVALAHVMNPESSRYHKLNLQNLVTGRQPTLEFRQHSATVSLEKITFWIRFCIALVQNSAALGKIRPFAELQRHDEPSPSSSRNHVDTEFHSLFQGVIKDRALRDYYRRRSRVLYDAIRNQHQLRAVQQEIVGIDLPPEVSCCRDCAQGGSCALKRRTLRHYCL